MGEAIIRTVHIVPRINDEASGPSYSVVQLCRALREDGCDTTLAVIDAEPSKLMPGFVKTFAGEGFPRKLGRSPEMLHWLRTAVNDGGVDVIHNHSLWMMPNVYPGWSTRGTNTPLVVSPRGTFSKWALNRSKWVKKAFWHTVQSHAIKHASCFHATADHEYRDIRRAGFKQPVCVIPNGVDIPIITKQPKENKELRKLLFLGRIHPVKGVDILLRAWAALYPRFSDWELEIVGPDNDGYMRDMIELTRTLKLQRVSFRGPLFNQDKVRAYQEAELYVLPSHSENFGMTVAESMASGTPAIATRGTPWSGLEHHGAGWWIDVGVPPLVACLEEALKYPSGKLAEMGVIGRKWMLQEYSWGKVASMMNGTYRWLLNGGEMPVWVKC